MSKARHQLHPAERPLAGVLRLLREHLAHVDELAGGGGPGALTAEQIHELRKACKAARALWRLLRETVSELAFKQFDRRVADMARGFASTRERTIREATFNELAASSTLDHSMLEHSKTLLALGDAAAIARDQVATVAASETHALRPIAPTETPPVLAALPELNFRARGQRKTLVRALKAQYKRGRRAFERSRRAPNDANLWHDFRKLVKYHNNQLAVLHASTGLNKRRKRLDLLAETLGAHHDLTDLEQHLRNATTNQPSAPSLEPLFELLGSKRELLLEHAVTLGRSLFERSPRRAVRWLVKHSASLR